MAIPLIIGLFCRVYLILNCPTIYFFDAYTYLDGALKLLNNGSANFSIGFPFLFALAGAIKTLSPILGVIDAARIFSLGCSLLIIYLLYRFGEIIGGKVLGTLIAIVASFEPYFISYSIVPHNDVFTIMVALLTLWLARSNWRYRFVICPILFFSAVFTRPEFYVVFIIPLILLLSHRLRSHNLKKKSIFVVYLTTIYILPFVFLFFLIVESYTRFSIVERIMLFPAQELLINTAKNIFVFSGNFLVNLAFVLLPVITVVMLILRTVTSVEIIPTKRVPIAVRLNSLEELKRVLCSYNMILILSFLVAFVVALAIVTVYAYSYKIVDGEILVNFSLTPRYIILPRIFLAFAFAYPFTWVIQKCLAE